MLGKLPYSVIFRLQLEDFGSQPRERSGAETHKLYHLSFPPSNDLKITPTFTRLTAIHSVAMEFEVMSFKSCLSL